MKRSEANKVATPHGKSQAARNECGAERAELDAILRCRRRDGVADAARNECDARRFSPEKTAALLRIADLPGQQPAEVDLGVTAADAFGDPGFERGLAGLDPVEKFAVGKPDFTGELPDRKPRGAAARRRRRSSSRRKSLVRGRQGWVKEFMARRFYSAPEKRTRTTVTLSHWRFW